MEENENKVFRIFKNSGIEVKCVGNQPPLEVLEAVLEKKIGFSEPTDLMDILDYVSRSWEYPGDLEDLVLYGPAGSGKTVLATILTAWLHPSVYVFDQDDVFKELETKLDRPKLLVVRSMTEVEERWLRCGSGLFIEMTPDPTKMTFPSTLAYAQMVMMRRYWGQ